MRRLALMTQPSCVACGLAVMGISIDRGNTGESSSEALTAAAAHQPTAIGGLR
jgi:hypothetical protein